MSRFKQLGLVLSGVCLGILLSLQLAAHANREAVPPTELPVDEVRNLSAVFGEIKRQYVEPVSDKKLIDDAISGMVSGLDPHSAYLNEEAFRDMQISIKGKFGGLGIEVTMEDGLVKVVSPIEDTPAYRAGVKAGDLIFKLDETPVRGLSLTDAVKRMRGEPGTSIQIAVLRKGETRPLEFSLTREEIQVRSVKSKLIEPGYGYVRITQFQERTTSDLAQHLVKLYKQGDLKGLVLDLRNNPGGLIDAAVGVSAAFLPPKSLVVYSQGRTPDAKRQYHATPAEYSRGEGDVLRDLPAGVKTVPVVVILNGGSASASEIVAGALQDFKRAKLLGIRSFGKGSVQSIFPLFQGQTGVKLTIAKYFTPLGRSIQAKGIDPDFLVDETPDGSSEPYYREADLNGHLSNPTEQSTTAHDGQDRAHSSSSSSSSSARKEPVARFEPASADDFQFQQALNVLKGLPVVVKTAESSATAAVAAGASEPK